MRETTQLVLVFNTTGQDEFSLRINNPVENLNEITILEAMTNIIASDVFEHKGHSLDSPASAYIREIVITNYLED